MRKLTPKDYDILEFNDLIKGKERVTADIENIKEQFEVFNTNKQQLENVTQVYSKPPKCQGLNTLSCDLYKLYDSTSQDTEKIKNAVKSISSIKCPYCGIEKPSHIDHFLPRSIFPEFSMYTPNLIYVCSTCNSIYKGDKIVNEEGERKYFNPYFDEYIEELVFLQCKIEVENGIYPNFKFYIDDLSETHNYEFTVIKNHFESMNLNFRYIEQISKEEFRRFKNRYIEKTIKQFKDVTLDKLKNDIEEKLDELYDLNENNWEKVFWNSLKDCDECLNLIVDKLIPID